MSFRREVLANQHMDDIRSIANTMSLVKGGRNERSPRTEISIEVVDSPAELKAMNNAACNADVRVVGTDRPNRKIANGEPVNLVTFLMDWQRHNGWTLQTVANMYPKLAWATAEYQHENFPMSSADNAAGGGGEE